MPVSGKPPYSVAKGGVAQLTREIALEYARQGIRCNAILPAQVMTPGFRKGLLDDPRFGEKLRQRFIAAIPIGRVLEPEDFVGPAVLLCSQAGAAITSHGHQSHCLPQSDRLPGSGRGIYPIQRAGAAGRPVGRGPGPLQERHTMCDARRFLLSIYFLDALLERWLEVTRRLLEAAGDNVDVLFYGEDVAFQNGPMVSPKTYEKIIQPYQRRVFRTLHDWSDAKLLYHNCGSVTWQIPDLIEWGVDALNPLQVNSYDMGDTASLKRRFGDKIAFWGAVDTSRVLPQGTPQDVHDEVRRRVSDLAPGGGYVLGTVHNIQAEVPPENICAIWEAADEL